jgi:hypothetical protein
MVHEQQVGAALGRLVNNRLAGVHGDRNVLHLSRVLDLEPVQGVRVVGDFSRP